PDIALIAGYNRQAQPVGQGYVLGAELTLPLFDRNQSAVREAEALQSGVDGLLQAIERTLRGEVAQAHARLTALLEERERFSQAVRTDAILRAALAGYREGEVSLVELLDARRAVVAAALRKLELDLAVRLADVALRQSTGALE
ncbi:MAG: TolC family protein, partial [Myxococcota bacterium]